MSSSEVAVTSSTVARRDLDDVQLHLIETMDDVFTFARWLGQARDEGTIAFDTETTGLRQGKDIVRLIQVGDSTHGWALQWDRWSGAFVDLIDRYDGNLTCHNAPFDWGMLQHMGVTIKRHRIEDTRPMCHIVDPTFSTALKPNAARYVDPRAGNAQKDLDEAIAHWGWGGIPIQFAAYWMYGALDPVLTRRVKDVLWPQISGQPSERAYHIENAVQWVTFDMERYGTHIDVEYARRNYDAFVEHCDVIKAWCIKNYNVNPGRNAQVIARLHDDGIEFTKATKGGGVALDADVLEGIDHPLAKQVLVRRKLEKLASTYLRHYIDDVDENDLLHPSINTLGARTSRMSMSGPNMQNLPTRVEDNRPARVVRNCVSARPGHTLLFCDFSQIEMRLLAWLSADPNMLKAFTSPGDFFVNLAIQVFNEPDFQKSDPRRGIIKNGGYAKIYGAGITKMAWTMGVDVEVVRKVMTEFDRQFAGVPRFQRDTYNLAMSRRNVEGRGYVECPLTGRRQVAEPGKEYALVNYLIQGAAASLFKMKLLELDEAGLGPWMMLVVHDEVILDVPNEHVLEVVKILQQVMNDTTIIAPVPVEAEVSFGQRWGDKMKWDEDRWLANDWRETALMIGR